MIESTQREEELFAAALALPVAERAAFLDRTVGDAADTGLRRRLDNLLRAHERADDLEAPLRPQNHCRERDQRRGQQAHVPQRQAPPECEHGVGQSSW